MKVFIIFLIFLLVDWLLIEFLVVLLRLTGIESEKAKFQVISLMTGTGFTTKESELITQHPIRRKIANAIMIVGYISTFTLVSFSVNMLMHFSTSPKGLLPLLVIVLVIAGGFAIIKKLGAIDKMEELLENHIRKNKAWLKFNKSTSQLISRNHGYGILEIYIDDKSVLIGQSILESTLSEKEIQVLNIDKGDQFIPYPKPSYVFEKNDRIVVYGNLKNIFKFFKK